jgi:GDP-L-fucose synthase
MNEQTEKELRIYVAGHRGLAGSAIVRALEARGYRNLITRTRGELDLTNQTAVREFFTSAKPDYVFMAAAKVGGILANDTYPADFIYQNLAIQNNVIHEGWSSGLKRMLFLGSSCIYPKSCPQPIREEYLLAGQLEPTNRAYALAKIAGIEMCLSYNRQYGTQYLCAMPTNLYGPGDNYDLNSSHVLPALLRKAIEAKRNCERNILVWGTGNPRREFLYVDDLAQACVHLMELSLRSSQIGEIPQLVNIGTGSDVTIRELADIILSVVGIDCEILFDTSKPDGTPQKLLDISKIERLGWRPKIDLKSGISMTYRDLDRKHRMHTM